MVQIFDFMQQYMCTIGYEKKIQNIIETKSVIVIWLIIYFYVYYLIFLLQ